MPGAAAAGAGAAGTPAVSAAAAGCGCGVVGADAGACVGGAEIAVLIGPIWGSEGRAVGAGGGTNACFWDSRAAQSWAALSGSPWTGRRELSVGLTLKELAATLAVPCPGEVLLAVRKGVLTILLSD